MRIKSLSFDIISSQSRYFTSSNLLSFVFMLLWCHLILFQATTFLSFVSFSKILSVIKSLLAAHSVLKFSFGNSPVFTNCTFNVAALDWNMDCQVFLVVYPSTTSMQTRLSRALRSPKMFPRRLHDTIKYWYLSKMATSPVAETVCEKFVGLHLW